MQEIIKVIVQIILMTICYYCAFRIGYRRGIKDAEKLFWKNEIEVNYDKDHK